MNLSSTGSYTTRGSNSLTLVKPNTSLPKFPKDLVLNTLPTVSNILILELTTDTTKPALETAISLSGGVPPPQLLPIKLVSNSTSTAALEFIGLL